jgi:hypothetical protein
MESRTSPGKRGSVQPISAFRAGVSSRFSSGLTLVALEATHTVHIVVLL